MTKIIKGIIKKLQICYRNLELIYPTECAFRDDLMIMTRNQRKLQYNLEIWHTFLQKRNLRINGDKTKIMIIGKNNMKMLVKLNEKMWKQWHFENSRIKFNCEDNQEVFITTDMKLYTCNSKISYWLFSKFTVVISLVNVINVCFTSINTLNSIIHFPNNCIQLLMVQIGRNAYLDCYICFFSIFQFSSFKI